ncbi:MAG: SPOR domain-containing protein, partial [Pseudomonadota bacterium]
EAFAPELEQEQKQEPIEAIEEPYFEAETAEPPPSLDEASDALLAELDLELTGEEFNAPTELAEPAVLEEIAAPAADFDDPLDALDSATEPTETLSEFDLDAVFEEALASEPVVAELNEVANTPAPVVEDVTLEALEAVETVASEPEDPLDELMSIMGEEPEAAPNAARDAQTMVPPSLDTAEMGQGEAVELPEFDLPDDLLEANEGGFGDVGAGAAVAAAGAGVTAGAAALAGRGDKASAPPSLDDPFDLDIDLDDAFDENRFEAELARDIEFAAHDLEARSGEPLPDDIDAFLQEEANLAAAGDAAVAAQASGASRGLKVAAIVGSLAIAGALGLFFVSGGSTPDSAGPIVVEADPDPVKIKPEDPGGIEVPNQDRAVFTENDGGVAPSQPSLVTTSEEPVDLAALPQAEEPKAEDRLLPDQADGGAAATQAAEGPAVAPRRVRTLVVRPDGTLEERPVEETQVVDTAATDTQSNSLQQLASLPAAETPAQPTTETSGTENAAPAAPAAPQPAETSEGSVAFQPPAAAPAASQPTAAAAAPAQPRAQVPVRRVQSQTITPPVIRDRPADQPVNIVNATTQQQVASAPQASGTFPEAPTANTATAAPAPAPAPATAPAAPASSSGFKVQIASLPSQSAAQQTSAQLLSRYRNVLGGRGVAIRQAQIEGRGTFYRIQVEASSRDDASSLCQRYKAAGGDCIVTR